MSAAIPALVAFLLGACQPDGSDARDRAPSTEPSAPEADVPATVSDSLRLWLEVPDEVRAGDSVPIALRVENVSDEPIDLHLRGRTIAFDLVVAGADGEVAWSRLEGEVIPAILRVETLGSGERLELEDTWDQRSNAGEAVAPGDYSVRGELLTEGEPLSTPSVPLRIIPAG